MIRGQTEARSRYFLLDQFQATFYWRDPVHIFIDSVSAAAAAAFRLKPL